MIYKYLIVSLLLFSSTLLNAQFELMDLCDFGNISKEEIYSDNEIEKYTHSYSDISGRNEIDYYTSKTTDFCRPLILFISGGFFVASDKEGLVEHAKYFARRGYHTAVLDYRLVDLEDRCTDLGWWQATQDVHAALKYSSALANLYDWASFNNQKVILVGSSAGAVTALTLTYSEPIDFIRYLPGKINELGGLNYSVFPPYIENPYKIIGTISLAGAMTDIINTYGYDFNETASTLFIHSLNDKTVPYDKGIAGSCEDTPGIKDIYGPAHLIPQITQSRFPVEIITLPEKLHVIPIGQYIDTISSFIYKISTDSLNNYALANNPQSYSNYKNKMTIYPNPSKGNFKIKIPFNNNDGSEENNLFSSLPYFFSQNGFDFGNRNINFYQTDISLIKIFDLSGTIVKSSIQEVSYFGNDILSLKTNLPRGTYIIKIKVFEETLTQKIVITH